MRLRTIRRLALASSIGIAGLTLAAAPGGATSPIAVDQGPNWTPTARLQFYSQDQGSQIMPLVWFEALKQPNGQPFLAGSLSRYGYLPNPASPTPGLPVGFTVNGSGNSTMVGMTCAACHTRQIVSGGIPYRIDGGPAIVDFQSFLADLDTAVGRVLSSGPAFTAFATAVLGPSPPPAQQAILKSAVQAWFLRYDTLIKRALPTPAWGPGRLDAVSMIFNRLTGLDLGPPPSYLIPANIKPAVAPVRYPFLWNAAIQDHTQWPGFAANGNAILGLARNLGEVYGVFATFAPQKAWYGIDYLDVNSANFKGLFALEELIKQIGPPQWPWAVNQSLLARGQAIFKRSTANGGCGDCHGIKPGITRPIGQKTWATPVLDVGTDTREYDILAWTAQSGVMNGASTIANPTPLKPVDAAINILGMAVLGSIEQYCLENPVTCLVDGSGKALTERPRVGGLKDLYKVKATAGAAYEARVLQGIWAAAPYLHNGSVPSLAQLLTPAAQRVKSFKVGSNYDQVNVGLAAKQTQFNQVFTATGCDELNSGNSNCGHEYGTTLPAADKRALLEYLKTL
ncbi:MAG: di-heme-cytochrome C peroxidase [Geminicoccaceae bacterium]